MTKRMVALVLTMSAMTMAAGAHAESRDRGFDRDHEGHEGHGGRFSAVAPEIDPSSAISALTLLLGGVTVLRSRVGKK